MFKEVLFWCEFPEEVDWNKFNSLLADKQCRVFFTASSKKEYLMLAKKVKASGVRTGVWPTLSVNEGYWFSGYSSKEAIARLKEFEAIPMKIDIEPPFPGEDYSLLKASWWLFEHMFIKKPHNTELLENTIHELSTKGEVIVSGFALPRWMRRRYGDPRTAKKRNFIFYSTFFLGSWILFKHFFKKEPQAYYAIGLTNQGIFRNEPEYASVVEFEKDIIKAKKIGIQRLVIYSIEGILKRDDAEDWLRVVFK